MVNRNYKRGDKTKHLTLGVDMATGIGSYKEETVLPEGSIALVERESVVRIVIEFDRKQLTGQVASIETTMGKGELRPDGSVIEGTIKTTPFLSTKVDEEDFTRKYGEGFYRSIANGNVEIKDGFAGQKLFDPETGADLPDPVE